MVTYTHGHMSIINRIQMSNMYLMFGRKKKKKNWREAESYEKKNTWFLCDFGANTYSIGHIKYIYICYADRFIYVSDPVYNICQLYSTHTVEPSSFIYDEPVHGEWRENKNSQWLCVLIIDIPQSGVGCICNCCRFVFKNCCFFLCSGL